MSGCAGRPGRRGTISNAPITRPLANSVAASGTAAGQRRSTCRFRNTMRTGDSSGEVVAADRVIRCRTGLRHRWRSDFAYGCSKQFRLGECVQQRQSQNFVSGFHGLVEFQRQIGLPGKRTEPFTVFEDEAAKRPMRKLQLDEGECCVGPRAGLDQALVLDETKPRQPRALGGDQVGYAIGLGEPRKSKRAGWRNEMALMSVSRPHDTISIGIAVSSAGRGWKMGKCAYRSEMRRAATL
jgi:hypothetical protein